MDIEKQINQLSSVKRELLLRRLRAKSAKLDRSKIIAYPRTSDRFCLSYAQERLWFLEQLTPGNSFYNIPAAIPLNFPLNVPVLNRVINEVLRRHESLRTVFQAPDGEPQQVILPHVDRSLEVINLRDTPENERQALATRLASEESLRPFDLATGPLCRFSLLILGDEEYILLLTMHHIVSDGWSMGILFNELTQLYTAFSIGRPSPLPEPPLQYADFAVWQREWLQGEEIERQFTYWREQLLNLPALQLTTDRPRPAIQSFRGDYLPISISPRLTSALKTMSTQEGVTLFMTLLAAFNLLLKRYTGQDDIAVGTYIANRNHREIEGLIGFFINTLVMRTNLSDDPSFRELLHRVKKIALGAYAHQDLPFSKLVYELQPDRDLSQNPLFQVVFHLFNAPTHQQGGSTANRPVPELTHHSAIFDLVFELAEEDGKLEGGFAYSTDLFEPATIARFARHFNTLLTGIVANPDLRLSELSMLNTTEVRQLLIEWNNRRSDFPLELSVVKLFDRQAAASPDRVALRSDSDEICYRELACRANQLARHLKGLGIGTEVLVGIALDRSIDAVVSILAVFKAGAAYLPLDASYPEDRLNFMLDDAGIRVVITRQGLRHQFVQSEMQVICMDTEWNVIARLDSTNLVDGTNLEQLAYVLYTSGTTGRPKGVANEHRQLLNRLHWMWETYPFSSAEVCCQKTALNFIDSVWEIFGPLLCGIPTVIIPDKTLKDPYELIEILRQHDVTRIWLVPSLLHAILDAYPDLELQLPHLKFWVSSGEVLSANLFRRFHEVMPESTLYNLYGTSEVWDVTWFVPEEGEEFDWRVPIGHPISNVEVFVLDRSGQPVPVGVPGELFVGGPGLPRGYISRPELNAEKFIPHPFSDIQGARLYRTGDLVRYRSDGKLEFIGRSDNQIKVRGFRIELGEIEAVLNKHPAVSDVTVISREERGNCSLIAYVVQSSEYQTESSPGETVSDVREEDEWSADKVAQWRSVWDETYSRDILVDDPSFNSSGFISSYTGQPIPAHEVHEWVDSAVKKVVSQEPGSILEIGCGTGLLLLRIAPHCDRFVGTDFSPAALSYVRHQVEKTSLNHVELLERNADDFEGFAKDSFDTVVLHSVAQYFPTVDYLLKVIDGAVSVTAPGGYIYIGDVRSLGLLDAFICSVEIAKAPPEKSVMSLRERVQIRLAQEQELVLDPSFFVSLRKRYPQVSEVRIELKCGQDQNEFTRFRYDVLIFLSDGVMAEKNNEPDSTDWLRDNLSIPRLRDFLEQSQPDEFCVKRVPNARVREALHALQYLTDESSDAPHSVGEMRTLLSQSTRDGIDPEKFLELASILPYDIHVLWSGPGLDHCFDVVFCRLGSGEQTVALPDMVGEIRSKPWHSYANNPLQGIFSHRLVPELRKYLATQLPDYQIPNSFVLLDSLPLTPSGKVDRGALPALENVRQVQAGKFIAPRTSVEEMLAEIWEELLNIHGIGVHDDFFTELGGHSLLATQLISQIRNKFHVEVSLRAFFEVPTIAALAAEIDQSGGTSQAQPMIRRLERNKYRAGAEN